MAEEQNKGKMAQQKAAMNRMKAAQRLGTMQRVMNKPRPAMANTAK